MENSIIHDFFSAHNVSDRFRALLELSKNRKQIHEAAKSPNFIAILESFFEDALSNRAPEDMLMAAAAVARVSSVIRSQRKNMEIIAKKYLVEQLPPPEIMQNPDDRYYIAKTCRMISAAWLPDYLAHAAIEEENAERARTEYVAGLFKSVGNLHIAFDMLSQKFTIWRTRTEKPAETAARRLKRILSSVRPALMEYGGEITPDAGKSLAVMLQAPFQRGVEVLEQEIRKELASEVAEIIHHLTRSRFSLATDPATYEAISVVKRWFPQYRWVDFADRSASVQKVTFDLLEGMTLLARQGITHNAMFDCLTVVLGTEDSARRKTAELGRSIASIPDDVRQWLIKGQTADDRKPPEATDLALRSAEQRENLSLASLLLDIERLDRRTMLIQRECLAELEVLDSNISKEINKYLEQARATIDGVRSFCNERGLRVRGKTNDVVEYSPIDHEVITGLTQGIRNVRLIEPVVEKISKTGVPSVVRKGLVEPC